MEIRVRKMGQDQATGIIRKRFMVRRWTDHNDTWNQLLSAGQREEES
jgi:hypothetical protein